MPHEDSFITLRGHRHRYIDTGDEKPSLLLLHGLSCSLDIFEQALPILSKPFRVLALDLLGFGQSDKPRTATYSLELYGSLIQEFMEKTAGNSGLPRYGLGHSMGGKYLLAAELLHPGSFDKLVLSNTDGFTELPGWVRTISWPGIRQLLKRIMTTETVATKVFSASFRYPETVDKASFAKNLRVARNRDAIDTVMALNRHYRLLDLAHTGLRKRLHTLDVPVMILWGDHDQYISPSVAGTAHEEIPGSELYVFENCGHSPMLEYPELFSEIVTGFLTNEKKQHPPCS
ncbi:alpha/beta hydrolase [Prosthecochloris sp. GSB1]|uniref:alpha/beta fold hydrolase n=1 Tax=Prosthecochloris sp. GSB1 TaxID=281093 RepID=UPI000B8CB586|nr:alpha/beta hydrolase [Prosthecochloris sp. GSB1]ASQ91618.1 alpha/beta hydrolase [Prosthecochloris sp. GSB1]